MTQTERREYLISELLKDMPEYGEIEVPKDGEEQKKLLRSLFNVRMPRPLSESFLEVQDAYLKEEIEEKGIVKAKDLTPAVGDLYLWQGDITALACDAIVNAANSALLGCFYPCHGCIDNAIHTYAGAELRLKCAEIMKAQEKPEETGKAKITPAYNLPCKYVIHTVGPIVGGRVTKEDERLLESCYRSALGLADKNGVRSIAFCCISTGEFHFPNKRAAEIAVSTAVNYKKETQSKIKVIFDVFKETDRKLYERELEKIKREI